MTFNESSIAFGVIRVPGTCSVRESPGGLRTGRELTVVLKAAQDIIGGFKRASDDVIMPEACAGPLPPGGRPYCVIERVIVNFLCASPAVTAFGSVVLYLCIMRVIMTYHPS
jgi:hypothetical protein